MKTNKLYSKDGFELAITDSICDCVEITDNVIEYFLKNKKNTTWIFQGLVDNNFAFCLEEVELNCGRTKKLDIVDIEDANEYTEFYNIDIGIFKNKSIAEILSLSNALTIMLISNDISISDEQDYEEGSVIFTYQDGSKLKVEAETFSFI